MMQNFVRAWTAILFLLHDNSIYKASVHFACMESASGFFESHKDFCLHGHAINVCKGEDLECGLQCLRNDGCQSYNCFPADRLSSSRVCHLNKETRKSRPENFKENQGATYFELMQIANSKFVCENNWRWIQPGYKGITCQSTGYSCKHIRDSGDSRGDGEYWIDPEKNGNPLKVFCDMTTNGGGWLLVANFLMDSSTLPTSWTAESSYRGISNFTNNKVGITKNAMKELRSHLSFTQLRFHCSKQQGRTFHVITVANSSGEAVVQYFSGQTDVRPSSCNSFERMHRDNSQLALQCDKWGNDGSQYVGKWGHFQYKAEKRMYNHAAFIAHKYHWVIVNNEWLCDDVGSNFAAILPGDFWKIYVR